MSKFIIIISVIFIILVMHYFYRRIKFIVLFRKTRSIFKKINQNYITQNEDDDAMFLENRLKKIRQSSQDIYLERYKKTIDIIKSQKRGYLKILDIGCGDAYLFKQLEKNYGIDKFKLYGIDISKRRIFLAKQRFKNKNNINFILGNAEKLPFIDNKFDIIISLENLEHLINPFKSIKEIKRILKPKGLLILSTPSKHTIFISYLNPFTWIESLISLYIPSILPPFHNLYRPKDKNTVIHRTFTIYELKQFFNNWNNLEIKTFNFIFENIFPQQFVKIYSKICSKINPLNKMGKHIIITARK